MLPLTPRGDLTHSPWGQPASFLPGFQSNWQREEMAE